MDAPPLPAVSCWLCGTGCVCLMGHGCHPYRVPLDAPAARGQRGQAHIGHNWSIKTGLRRSLWPCSTQPSVQPVGHGCHPYRVLSRPGLVKGRYALTLDLSRPGVWAYYADALSGMGFYWPIAMAIVHPGVFRLRRSLRGASASIGMVKKK